MIETMNYIDFKEFLLSNIYPKFGEQPLRFRYWDKKALRSLYMDFLRPNYNTIRNHNELCHLLFEVEKNLEYDQSKSPKKRK